MRTPSRYDSDSESSRHKIDDSISFIGDLRDLRLVAGILKQLNRKVVTERARTAIRKYNGLISNILDSNPLATRQPMRFADGYDWRFIEKRSADETGSHALRWTDKCDVKSPGLDVRQELNRFVLDDADVNIWSLLSEIIEEHRKQSSCRAIDSAYTQLRSFRPCYFPEASFKFVGLCKKLSGLTKQLPSFLI